MNLKTYITADISRTNISFVCTSHEMAQTNVLYSQTFKGRFTKQGRLHNIDSIVEAFNKATVELNKILGYRPTNINITLNHESIRIQKSTSSLRIINENQIVTQLDVDNINRLATNVGLDDNYTQIHAQPFRFVLDSDVAIYKDPIGYEATDLSVDMLIYSASTNIVNDIKYITKTAGYKISLFTPSGIGLGHEAASVMELDKGVAIVDIGERETTINIFKKENLIATKILNTGYFKIIKDIMYYLNVDKETAITFFDKVAISMDESINEYNVFTRYNNDSGKMQKFTNKNISNVAKARMKDICIEVEAAIYELIKPDSVNIILTGMLANVNGLKYAVSECEFAEKMRTYVPNQIGARDATLTAALGNSYFIFINEDARQEIGIPMQRHEVGGFKNMLEKLFRKSQKSNTRQSA